MINKLSRAAIISLFVAVIFSLMPVCGQLSGGVIGAQEVSAFFPNTIGVGYYDNSGTAHDVILDSEHPYYINGGSEPLAEEPSGGYNAYYDVSSRTLHLNHYDGIEIDEREGSDKLTVVLEGDNRIVSDNFCGIGANKDLEVTSTSEGKLTIICNDAGDYVGIVSGGDIDISGSADIDIQVSLNDHDPLGIATYYGSVSITDSSKVKILVEDTGALDNAYGIYAKNNLVLTTTKPIEITVKNTGEQGSATGLHSNNDNISISNTENIKMDLAAHTIVVYDPIESLKSVMDAAGYHSVVVEETGHVVYTIERKIMTPELIDIQFDESQILPLTEEMTGDGVNELFLAGIQSPAGTSYPASATEGWYVKLTENTKFSETGTAPLVKGSGYYFTFDLALENINYRWNSAQEFTVNGYTGDDLLFYEYEQDGRRLYRVSYKVYVPEYVIDGDPIELSQDTYVYDGHYQEPGVSVIHEGYYVPLDSYVVTYKNNRNVGTATAIAAGRALYVGTTSKTFKINPKGTKQKTPSRAKKALTVKWNKQSEKMSSSRITGYQIQLATNSSFTKNKKNVWVKGYKSVSKKVTKLKAKKKYYIKVRTYMTVGGVKYYSEWSNVKTAKTK